MTHFGIVSPPVPGHLNPMFALAAELREAGHRVTFFQMADVEAPVSSEGFEFHPLGLSSHPPGTLSRSLTRIAHLRGNAAMRFTVGEIAATTEMFCRDLPAAIRRSGIDALLVDQMEPAGALAARYLEVPFVTICNALLMNRDPEAPPPFTSWAYRPGAFARVRNAAGYLASGVVLSPVSKVLARYRKQWHLKSSRHPDGEFSDRLQVSQQPRSFEYPRKNLPRAFEFGGPFRKPGNGGEGFPWEKLDGRPLVYASLGTLQNRNLALFRIFAEACQALPVQLVISHGRGLGIGEVAELTRLGALVVDYAPQAELLSRASAAVTHAGLNTVLDCLSRGVPMVTIPITYEQPAIAARVAWTGTGKVIRLRQASAEAVREAVTRLLQEKRWRERAGAIADEIAANGGTKAVAARIVTSLSH